MESFGLWRANAVKATDVIRLHRLTEIDQAIRH
jgi:hypothetical protein